MPEMTTEFKEQLFDFLKENLCLGEMSKKTDFGGLSSTINLVLCGEVISTVWIEK